MPQVAIMKCTVKIYVHKTEYVDQNFITVLNIVKPNITVLNIYVTEHYRTLPN